jgi:hypothetical protein
MIDERVKPADRDKQSAHVFSEILSVHGIDPKGGSNRGIIIRSGATPIPRFSLLAG